MKILGFLTLCFGGAFIFWGALMLAFPEGTSVTAASVVGGAGLSMATDGVLFAGLALVFYKLAKE